MGIRLIGFDYSDGIEDVLLCDGITHTPVMLAMHWPPTPDDCPYADHSPEAREMRKYDETPVLISHVQPCDGLCQQFTDIAPELREQLKKFSLEVMDFYGRQLPTGMLVSDEVEALLQGPLMAVEVGTTYSKRCSQSTRWLLNDGRILRLETDFSWAREEHPVLYQKHELKIVKEDWCLDRLDDLQVHEQVRIALREEA